MKKMIFSMGRCTKALNLSKFILFKKIIRKATQEINPQLEGNIALSFATKSEIKKIKKKFFGINRETDVIAFNYVKDFCGISAEIIICPQVAKERAAEFGQDYFSELILYAVHGLLHIAGFDDQTKSSSAVMRKMENKIISILDKEFLFKSQKKRQIIFNHIN